ncbi:hypothetical protein ACIQOD_32135, partial [Streptomyces sp. NPDC091259]
MNRACARRLLAVPVLVWAAMSVTPAVADSRASTSISPGDGTDPVGISTAANGVRAVAGEGGGHHDDAREDGRGNDLGNGRAGGRDDGPGHGWDHGWGHHHGHHCPPPPPPPCPP